MSEPTNDGGNAFPATGDSDNGMSLRDYFAAHALQGMLAAPSLKLQIKDSEIAWAAFAMADAMLAERAKGKQ